MIDWANIKPTISAQVANLADLDPTKVRWVDEPSGLVNGVLPVVWLRVSSVVSNGIEEERINPPNALDPQQVNVCGQREFTLSIRCESFTSDVADPLYSGNIAEKIKTRIMRSTAREQRNGFFGIREKLGVKWFSYIEDGRPIQTHVLDLLCTTVNNDFDTDEDAGNWIGEALISGPVKDTSGTTLGTVNDDANAKP